MNNQLLVILFTLLIISGCNFSFFVKTDKVIRTDYGFTIYSGLPGEEFFVSVKDSSYLRKVENIFDTLKLNYGFQVAGLPRSNKIELLDYSTTYIDAQFSDTLAGIIEEIHVIPSVAYYVTDKSFGDVFNNDAKMIYYVGKKEIKFKFKQERMRTYSIRPFAHFR